MMKLPLLALLISLSCCCSAAAFDYGKFISCNKMNRRPVVVFHTSFGRLVHDLSHNTAQINAMAEKNPILKKKNMQVVGLAARGIVSQIQISEAQLVPLTKDAACLFVGKIEFFVGMQDPTIYVTNEYPKNSCQFAVTLRHEQTHQRINYLTLRYFLPLIDQAARKAAYSVRAVKIPSTDKSDIDEGFKRLYRYYRARLQPIMDTFNEAVNQQQSKLDNLVSYSYQWEICKNYEREHPADAQR